MMTWGIWGITLLLSTALAQETAPCREWTEMSLSGTFLNEFIRPATNPVVVLPVPIDRCVKNSQEISIRDPFGKKVGVLRVNGLWSGVYSEKKVLESPEKSPLRSFDKVLSDRGYDFISLLSAFFRQVFGQDVMPRPSIHLVEGVLVKDSDYVLNWNSFSRPRGLAKVRTGDYAAILNHLNRGLPVVAAPFNGGADDVNAWRIPGAILPPAGLSCEPSCAFDWLRLSRSIRAGKDILRGLDPQKPIAVYSSLTDPWAGVNAIEWLQAEGFQDILWLPAGPEEWNAPERLAQDSQDHEVPAITADELLKLPKDKTLILDVRIKTRYVDGHLPGAVNDPAVVYPRDARKKNALVSAAYGGLKFGIERFLKDGKNNIVVYANNESPLPLWMAVKALRNELDVLERKDVTVRAYIGGMADWVARADWLDPKIYLIEK